MIIIKRWELIAAMVAQAYDGYSKSWSASSRQTAQTAMRLPQPVVHTIREITFQEDSELCSTQENFNAVGAKTAWQMEAFGDCWSYFRLLLTPSLKAKTLFMNDSLRDSRNTQVNNIYWCRHYIGGNLLKPVQHTTAFLMWKHAIYVLQEEDIFLWLLETEAWPGELQTLLHNMLRTTRMCNELTESCGNDTYTQQPLLDAFWRQYPVKTKSLIERAE